MAKLSRVLTPDGVSLTLRHLTPAPGSQPRNYPVLLLHGLASGHLGFHFPGRSLARYLSSRGFDCYLPELRGHGDSHAPDSWDLDDYLEHDLPALLDEVHDRSGRQRIHWVGHSMGGVLLFCLGIREPEIPLASGVTLGSALDYRHGKTDFRLLLKGRPLAKRLRGARWRVPYQRFTRGIARLSGTPVMAPVDAFNFHRRNVEARIIRQIHAEGFHSIPIALLLSLATTFEPDGLSCRQGVPYLPRAHRFQVPTRLIAGNRDRQVAPQAVEHTAEVLGARTNVQMLSRRHGTQEDYGHWDLLVGRHAEREVWPLIAEWLEQHEE